MCIVKYRFQPVFKVREEGLRALRERVRERERERGRERVWERGRV